MQIALLYFIITFTISQSLVMNWSDKPLLWPLKICSLITGLFTNRDNQISWKNDQPFREDSALIARDVLLSIGFITVAWQGSLKVFKDLKAKIRQLHD